MSHLKVLGLAATIALVAAGGANANYTVQDVTFPTDPTFTQLLGINNAGTIAGYHGAAINQGFTLVLPNSFTSEMFPGSTQTQVVGINGAGDTAGFYIDAGGTTHGFTNIGGVFATVDRPSTAFNQLLGINNSNVTVGYSSTDPAGMVNQLAYSEKGGTFTDINGLLPSNKNSQATGINKAGSIVGFFLPTATTSDGFLDVGGTITDILFPGSTFTQALGINANGDIVGFYVDTNNVQHGFTDTNGSFTSFDPLNSISTTINGINDLGQIVGFFTDPNDNVVGFVGTPTPEPGTMLLFISGLLGLRLVRRRR